MRGSSTSCHSPSAGRCRFRAAPGQGGGGRRIPGRRGGSRANLNLLDPCEHLSQKTEIDGRADGRAPGAAEMDLTTVGVTKARAGRARAPQPEQGISGTEKTVQVPGGRWPAWLPSPQLCAYPRAASRGSWRPIPGAPPAPMLTAWTPPVSFPVQPGQCPCSPAPRALDIHRASRGAPKGGSVRGGLGLLGPTGAY